MDFYGVFGCSCSASPREAVVALVMCLLVTEWPKKRSLTFVEILLQMQRSLFVGGALSWDYLGEWDNIMVKSF